MNPCFLFRWTKSFLKFRLHLRTILEAKLPAIVHERCQPLLSGSKIMLLNNVFIENIRILAIFLATFFYNEQLSSILRAQSGQAYTKKMK